MAFVDLKVQRKMLCARQRQLKMENNAFPGTAVDNLRLIYFFLVFSLLLFCILRITFTGFYFIIIWRKKSGKSMY